MRYRITAVKTKMIHRSRADLPKVMKRRWRGFSKAFGEWDEGLCSASDVAEAGMKYVAVVATLLEGRGDGADHAVSFEW